MREPFEREVIRPFLEAYQQGLTPNPCVLCNPKIKFGLLWEEARLLGADRLATGHYARILPPRTQSERFRLRRGVDPAKDQSYFLYGLTQSQLSSILFPLGDFTKREVQKWAEDQSLASALPAESQEICFIPSGSYFEFLRERLEHSSSFAKGPIVDVSGKVLGEHGSICGYTIGQRRGLGIASTAPYYVVGIEPETNTVRVGRADDLFRDELRADGVNWVSIPPPTEPLHALVRIRNQHKPAPARVTPLGDSKVGVLFDEPQRAVAPGQAAVFYKDELVLGGGTIRSASWSRSS
jgi:tRNA-specific 2-thiouridylase